MRWIATTVLVLALVGCVRDPQPPYESRYSEPVADKPIPVAVLGDSFSSGTEYGGLGAKGWPNLATLQLRDQGINIAVARGDQKGAGWVEPNSNGVVFSTEAARKVGPTTQLVVLFGSLNDGSVPLDVLSTAVAATLADVKSAAPQAKLLVIGPPTLGRGTPEKPGRMPAVRDAIRAPAEAAGAMFVDPITENWFNNPSLIGTDGVHPTDAGHQMMADRIVPLISAQIANSSAHA